MHIELFDDALEVSDVDHPMDHVLPLTARGERYTSYSRAVRDLVRPRLLENRISYRLLGVNPGPPLTMRFATTTFFEVFDRKQYLAHEFKRVFLDSGGAGSRPGGFAPPGIDRQPVRCDPAAGLAQHQQLDDPSGSDRWASVHAAPTRPRCRGPHDGASPHVIDYDSEEPFAGSQAAKAAGRMRLWHCGLVVDALTLGPSQRTVAVIDHETYDELFTSAVKSNDEGHRVGHGGRSDIPFTAEAIDRLQPRMTASSYTGLRLAWRDRHLLLD